MSAAFLTLDSMVRRVNRLPFSALDDDLLALDADRGYVYSMNATSAAIWELFREPTSIRAACRTLTGRYAVDEATCERDVLSTLTELLQAGLVEVIDAVSPADR